MTPSLPLVETWHTQYTCNKCTLVFSSMEYYCRSTFRLFLSYTQLIPSIDLGIFFLFDLWVVMKCFTYTVGCGSLPWLGSLGLLPLRQSDTSWPWSSQLQLTRSKLARSAQQSQHEFNNNLSYSIHH